MPYPEFGKKTQISMMSVPFHLNLLSTQVTGAPLKQNPYSMSTTDTGKKKNKTKQNKYFRRRQERTAIAEYYSCILSFHTCCAIAVPPHSFFPSVIILFSFVSPPSLPPGFG